MKLDSPFVGIEKYDMASGVSSSDQSCCPVDLEVLLAGKLEVFLPLAASIGLGGLTAVGERSCCEVALDMGLCIEPTGASIEVLESADWPCVDDRRNGWDRSSAMLNRRRGSYNGEHMTNKRHGGC